MAHTSKSKTMAKQQKLLEKDAREKILLIYRKSLTHQFPILTKTALRTGNHSFRSTPI